MCLHYQISGLSHQCRGQKIGNKINGKELSPQTDPCGNGKLKYKKDGTLPWLVWLSGVSTGLRTKGSPVGFPVRAHAWVAGQVPSWGRTRGNNTLMFLSLSLPLCLKINKLNL